MVTSGHGRGHIGSWSHRVVVVDTSGHGHIGSWSWSHLVVVTSGRGRGYVGSWSWSRQVVAVDTSGHGRRYIVSWTHRVVVVNTSGPGQIGSPTHRVVDISDHCHINTLPSEELSRLGEDKMTQARVYLLYLLSVPICFLCQLT